MGTERWRNVRKEWREREQDLDQGEESFKWNWKHMKSVFFWYPNAHRLATSYNGPSEWDRVSVRGRETAKPHERRPRLHLSFRHCNSRSSTSSSLESLICFFFFFFLAYCQLLSAPFWKRGLVCIFSVTVHKQLPILLLQLRSSIHVREIRLRSCFQLAYTCWCMSTKIQILL